LAKVEDRPFRGGLHQILVAGKRLTIGRRPAGSAACATTRGEDECDGTVLALMPTRRVWQPAEALLRGATRASGLLRLRGDFENRFSYPRNESQRFVSHGRIDRPTKPGIYRVHISFVRNLMPTVHDKPESELDVLR
jgi:hypothetical protein